MLEGKSYCIYKDIKIGLVVKLFIEVIIIFKFEWMNKRKKDSFLFFEKYMNVCVFFFFKL